MTHAEKDKLRYPRPFFLSEQEVKLFPDGDGPSLFMSPSLHVSRDKLMTAIDQVERLCEWLEERKFNAK